MGRHSCCVKQKLRKGLWSPEEDEKLFNHMARYGTNGCCWSSVPRLAGLQRCGKSCRLRWINYLRPDLKRGAFSQEEEDVIINLHKILGNRWACIAARLPGRTDNEIKNFWNSYLKKKLVKQGIDPATHKPLAEIQVKGEKDESLQPIEVKNLSSLRAHEPTFLIGDPLSNINIGLVDSSRGMNGSELECSLPLLEFQAGLDPGVFNPSPLMSQFPSNSRLFIHQDPIEMIPGIEFSSLPSLTNFEDLASKQCPSNSSNISSQASGLHVNGASEIEALDCPYDVQVKSEEYFKPNAWQSEEQLITDYQSSVSLSSYDLLSLTEDFTGTKYGIFDQL